MDQITAKYLEEFSGEYDLSGLTESQRFEHFCVHLVVGRLTPASFDTQDLVITEDSLKRTGEDTGLDAIAVIVNDKLVTDKDEFEEIASVDPTIDVEFVFIQAETSSGFDGGKIGTFGFGAVDFFRDPPRANRNQNVSRFVEIKQAVYDRSKQFKHGNPRCRLYYITTGKVMPDANLDARMMAPREELEGTALFSKVTFDRLGSDYLQEQYRRSRNSVSATIQFPFKVTIDPPAGVDQAYAGYLPWSEFKKVLVNEAGVMRSGLFVSNPRDFEDYNDVNSEIQDTIQSEHKNRFVLMNNGVTILARRIGPSGNKFELDDYQIVNGCQTSNVLYDNREFLDDTVLIPVKLIGTVDSDVTKAVIRGTNKQTAIKDEQFFAMEDYAKKIEEFFQAYPLPQRIYYERRSNQYERENIEKTRVISHPNLVKALAGMFLNEPHRTTRSYSVLKKKVGSEIFHKDHKLEPYYAAALAWYKVEYCFRNGKLEPKLKPARFHIMMAMRIINSGDAPSSMMSNEMERYAKKIIETLQDQERSEGLVLSAAQIVVGVANGEFDRDNIRTEGFTERTISAAKEHRSSLAAVVNEG